MSDEPTELPTSLSDLHRHLDGSLRPGTLVELARAESVNLPADLTALRFHSGMGLQGALERFGITLATLQKPASVRRVATEMCEDARAEGVTTLEIRFAPQLHRGASIEEIVDAAVEGIDGRAGLLLCGLYGEPPDVTNRLVEVAASRPAVVGIDLAGGPAPTHEHRLEDYAPAFSRARDLGLGRTVHAGEGRPPGEIRTAVETLHAQRIGHGTTLLDDPDVVDLLLKRGITVEACPTSNVHTGVIPDVASHPLPRWLKQGIAVCVCADNTFFSATDAREELRHIGAIDGVGAAELRRVTTSGHEAAFRR